MDTLPKTMTFSCLVKKGQCEIRKRPIPVLKDYDVLIKMKACNICTVDYQQFMGLREHQGYPMIQWQVAMKVAEKSSLLVIK